MKMKKLGFLIVFVTTLFAGLKSAELSITASLAKHTTGTWTDWIPGELYALSIILLIISLISLVGFIVMFFLKQEEDSQK